MMRNITDVFSRSVVLTCMDIIIIIIISQLVKVCFIVTADGEIELL